MKSNRGDDGGDVDITDLLVKWREGDKATLDRLIPLVYRELHRVARARLRRQPPGGALQTTALVHETYLRFASLHRLTVENRSHFFALAARLMRQILVDHSRRANAQKRGGTTVVSVDPDAVAVDGEVIDVLALNHALEELTALDERLCRVVELKFFAGLTIDETAQALNVSRATVERDWAVAKAWLYDRLRSGI